MAHSFRRALRSIACCCALAPFMVSARAEAQDAPTGAPPPDAKALVDAPTDSATVPVIAKPVDGTNATMSAGGQLATGNSRLLALTLNGLFESRWGMNAIGASVLGNYGQGASPGNNIVETTENVQGRVRYERYVTDQAGFFLINTVRRDRFEGLDARYNLDPGFKYLFLSASVTTLWLEAGYDFQYDVRRDDARFQLDPTGARIPGAPLLDKTSVNHSIRGFVGFKHAFNEEVTLSTGVEYIQSVTDTSHRWLNGDLLFAAKVGAGLAVGLGFSLRYDSDPLPAKKDLDTATTLNLIYAFSDAAPPKPATVVVCEPPPPPPPASNPPPPPPPSTMAPTPAPETVPPPPQG